MPETAPLAGPEIEVVFSNLSLPLPLQLAGSVGQYESHLTAIGAAGLQVTPQYSRFCARLLHRADQLLVTPELWKRPESLSRLEMQEALFDLRGLGLGKDPSYEDETLKRLVRSGHSGFRKDDHDESRVMARLFPRMSESLIQLRRMQEVVGRLAVVLYSNREGGACMYNVDNAPFGLRTIQPKAEDWRAWGLAEDASRPEIAYIHAQHGFVRSPLFDYDGFHDAGFIDPMALCSRLSAAGLLRAYHLSIGRADMTKSDDQLRQRTTQAMLAFMKSPKAALATEEGEKLQLVVRDWKNDPRHAGQRRQIVVEHWPGVSRRQARRHQRAITETVETIAGAA
jgi:hypothetical protein